jgi:hypothetical protein
VLIAQADGPPANRIATDLVLHSDVVIDRPAAAIWPYIVAPNIWKKGPKLNQVGGDAGKPGEIFAAVPRENTGESVFYVKNVEVVPNERRTMKLYQDNNGPLMGYASWELEEENGRTRVSYHVYTESLLSKQITTSKLSELEKQDMEQHDKRFREELLDLKKLVESK